VIVSPFEIQGLEFREQGHLYLLDGNPVPSVSEVLGCMNSDWKMPWVKKKIKKYLMEHPAERTPELFEQTVDKALQAAEEERDQAAGIGSEVHNWIKSYIMFRDQVSSAPSLAGLSKRGKESIAEFLQWEKGRKVEYVASELKLASRKYQFAGTLDTVVRIESRLGIVDFKTAAAVRRSNYLQTAAYQLMWEEADVRRQFPIDMRRILLLPRTGNPFQMHEVRTTYEEDRDTFLALRTTCRWEARVKPIFSWQ
jgi:hypothetical protein